MVTMELSDVLTLIGLFFGLGVQWLFLDRRLTKVETKIEILLPKSAQGND